jgi:uncharacterized repeat protein (TIGR02543 family)
MTASGWSFSSQEALVAGKTGTYSYLPSDSSVTLNNASGEFGRAEISNGTLTITILRPDNSVAGYGTFTKNQNGGGQQYTVTFNAQGGEVNPPTIQVAEGGSVTNLPVPIRTGYTFDGWYTQDGTQFTAATAVNGDITVSARWSEGGGGQQYTVTLNAQGGEVNPSTTQVAAGGSVTNLPVPTRTGYTFDGRYTQDGTQFTAATAVNGDITVSARWSGGGGDKEGVYIGLISFAEKATDLTGGTPVFLDASGRNSLISKLTDDYTRTSQIGTALFYGVH